MASDLDDRSVLRVTDDEGEGWPLWLHELDELVPEIVSEILLDRGSHFWPEYPWEIGPDGLPDGPTAGVQAVLDRESRRALDALSVGREYRFPPCVGESHSRDVLWIEDGEG